MTKVMDRKVDRVKAQRRKEMERLDVKIAEGRHVAEAILAEVRIMENARAELAVEITPKRPEESVPRSSRRIAGPKAIALVASVLASVGRTTQAEIVRETGKNSGTVTHALRVLEDDSLVRRTGRRERGSDEWAWLGKAEDLARLEEAA